MKKLNESEIIVYVKIIMYKNLFFVYFIQFNRAFFVQFLHLSNSFILDIQSMLRDYRHMAKLLLFPIFAPKGFRNMTREQ